MENNIKHNSTSAGRNALLSGISLGFAALLVLFYYLGMAKADLAALGCFFGMLIIVISLVCIPRKNDIDRKRSRV